VHYIVTEWRLAIVINQPLSLICSVLLLAPQVVNTTVDGF